MKIFNAFLVQIFSLFDNKLIDSKLFLKKVLKKSIFRVNYPCFQFLILDDSLEVCVLILVIVLIVFV